MERKLNFYPGLYLGESISPEKLDKLKRELKSKPLLSSLYVLTLSQNPSNQLEIYAARLLAQPYYRKYPPYIIGIAADYDEAVSLVEQIVQECIRERGDCALKEYLLC